MREALALVLVAATILAGCSAPPASPPPASSPETATEPARLALAPPAFVDAPRLAVSLALSEAWLKPFGRFEARAEAPEAKEVAWFIEHEEVEPRATVVDGEVYLLKSTTPDHHNTAGPRTKVHLADVQADGRARAWRFATAGRYHLEAAGAPLVVNVWPSAPDAGSQVFLVEEAGRARFEPPELDVPPGGRVLFWSHVAGSHDLRERGFAAHVPVESASPEMRPIDEGLYRLLAVAIGPRGERGFAAEPLLVDFERPSERVVLGPVTGRFLAPGARSEEERTVSWRAVFPLRSLSIAFEASGPAEAPASIEVAVELDGQTIAEVSSLSASALDLADLPEGSYVVRIRGEHGAFVGYELSGEALYRLPVPERLRAARSE